MHSLAVKPKSATVKHEVTNLGIKTGTGVGLYFISGWAFILYLVYQGVMVLRGLGR